jgi:hypothetical protein
MKPARRTCLVLSAFAIATIALPRRAPSQSAPPAARATTDSLAYRHRLLGVFDEQTGDPLQGAEVRDLYSGTVALTTATGTVSLAFLPVGRTLVVIRKLGYLPRTLFVSIAPADTAAQTLLLTPQPVTLPTVTTTDSADSHLPPVLREFERRRRAGQGRFISEAQLRARDGQQMSTVLATLPGLSVRSGRVVGTHGTSAGPVIMSAGVSCYATVYQDGAMIYQAAFQLQAKTPQPPPDFSRLRVDEYSAVEYYASPAEYPPSVSPTNNSCGVLMLWTRVR